MKRLRPAPLRLVAVGLAAACLALPGQGGAALAADFPSAVAEPDGYRMDAYRAPVPSSLSGGTVVDTPAAKALHDRGIAFVDVLPRPPRPQNLPEGTIWHPKERTNIPGSLWLVDTGYGALAPVMEAYFMQGLAKATGGDKAAPVVIYCQRDCWMSWNAARRAIAAGYSAIHWYPDGTEGWAEAGLPLVAAEPEPRPDE
ncbi:PQQ-dependent catabolism-associated CXXCW motif protein [Aurantimonas endophytica]|nr:PQQ-dependent catabolism-associated CXXCW motif protein [Aurantimonas endophytica]MCO6404226.1 PQQ-dependent catabolism-associated CXXCW motif protein [Aurantimonas endophytica]